MKTTNKDFKQFKESFLKYVDKWKITGWEIVFEHKKLDGWNADIQRDIENRQALVCFNTERGKHFDLEYIARHEVLHLLIARLSVYGRSRYVTRSETDEAEEELVKHLDELIS